MEAGIRSWGSLPLEIRRMILKSLIQDGCCEARYATISRELQAVVEQKNFSRLKLTPSHLACFGDIVYRRRELVRYLWLCIELQDYDCSQCADEETDTWHESNTNIIKATIRELFIILSTWKPSGSLVLDISVHSPSDSKHHLKYIHFGSDAIPEFNDVQDGADAHDPRHGWVNGRQVSLPPRKSINRLFEDIEMAPDFWQELPEVTAVTGLLLRRQTRRRWEPGSLELLFTLLPRLKEIYYEPWREWGRLDQRWTDESNQVLFESLIPNQLKRLVLFEDFNDEYITLFQGVYDLLDAEPIRTANLAVSKALAEASLSLEHLSASFTVDAKYFFRAPQSTWTWNKLATLVLTSGLLTPSHSSTEINDMLQAAAAAAMSMPALTAMELWNGGRGFPVSSNTKQPRFRSLPQLLGEAVGIYHWSLVWSGLGRPWQPSPLDVGFTLSKNGSTPTLSSGVMVTLFVV